MMDYKYWLRRAKIRSAGHDKAALYYRKIYNVMGVCAIIFATLAGLSGGAGAIIEQITKTCPLFNYYIPTAICALLSAILGAVQKFLKYDEIAANHHIAAAKFRVIRQDIEGLIGAKPMTISKENENSIKEKWEKADQNAETLQKKFFDRAEKELERETEEEPPEERRYKGILKELFVFNNENWEKIGDDRKWQYDLGDVIIRIRKKLGEINMHFDSKTIDQNNNEKNYYVTADGFYDKPVAILEYTFQDHETKKDKFKGAMVLRVTDLDTIYGIWVTTGVLDKLGFPSGSIKLEPIN